MFNGKLSPNMEVHHKDGNRANHQPGNLVALPKDYHIELHRRANKEITERERSRILDDETKLDFIAIRNIIKKRWPKMLLVPVWALIGLWIWNAVLVSTFSAPELTYWKMLGLMYLVRFFVPRGYEVEIKDNSDFDAFRNRVG